MANFDKELIGPYFEHGVDLTNRRVFLGDIDEDTVGAAVKGLYLMETESKTEPCELFISSVGGEIYETLALYDVIQTLKCPIHTFAFGKCQSAAPLLLAAGEPGQRWVAQHVAFMYHDYIASIEGRGAQLQAEMKHNEQLGRIWTQLLAKHSNKDVKFWNSKSAKPADFYFGSEEALEWGLADAVWSEKD